MPHVQRFHAQHTASVCAGGPFQQSKNVPAKEKWNQDCHCDLIFVVCMPPDSPRRPIDQLLNRPDVKVVARTASIPASSVDFAYTTSVLEHVECPVCELRALRRILKPRGEILVMVVSEGAPCMKALDMWHSQQLSYDSNTVLSIRCQSA